jgi:hypothetical protein
MPLTLQAKGPVAGWVSSVITRDGLRTVYLYWSAITIVCCGRVAPCEPRCWASDAIVAMAKSGVYLECSRNAQQRPKERNSGRRWY